MCDEGALNLRNAIIMQAIKDYKSALKKRDCKQLSKNAKDLKFTERQKQIMDLYNKGLSYKEIAEKIKCSWQNVYGIVRDVTRKIKKHYGIDEETALQRNDAINELEGIKRFFFSEWFEQLCDIDPQKIIDHLESEYKKSKEKESKKHLKFA